MKRFSGLVSFDHGKVRGRGVSSGLSIISRQTSEATCEARFGRDLGVAICSSLVVGGCVSVGSWRRPHVCARAGKHCRQSYDNLLLLEWLRSTEYRRPGCPGCNDWGVHELKVVSPPSPGVY